VPKPAIFLNIIESTLKKKITGVTLCKLQLYLTTVQLSLQMHPRFRPPFADEQPYQILCAVREIHHWFHCTQWLG